MVRNDGAKGFYLQSLLVATDGAIASFGHDLRRLRPNIVVEGVDGMSKRDWLSASLRIGKVAICIQDLRLRCIMMSYDPNTQEQDREITRGIDRRFEGKLALNCFGSAGGEFAVGDEVELVQGQAFTSSVL